MEYVSYWPAPGPPGPTRTPPGPGAAAAAADCWFSEVLEPQQNTVKIYKRGKNLKSFRIVEAVF